VGKERLTTFFLLPCLRSYALFFESSFFCRLSHSPIFQFRWTRKSLHRFMYIFFNSLFSFGNKTNKLHAIPRSIAQCFASVQLKFANQSGFSDLRSDLQGSSAPSPINSFKKICTSQKSCGMFVDRGPLRGGTINRV